MPPIRKNRGIPKGPSRMGETGRIPQNAGQSAKICEKRALPARQREKIQAVLRRRMNRPDALASLHLLFRCLLRYFFDCQHLFFCHTVICFRFLHRGLLLQSHPQLLIHLCQIERLRVVLPAAPQIAVPRFHILMLRMLLIRDRRTKNREPPQSSGGQARSPSRQ